MGSIKNSLVIGVGVDGGHEQVLMNAPISIAIAAASTIKVLSLLIKYPKTLGSVAFDSKYGFFNQI